MESMERDDAGDLQPCFFVICEASRKSADMTANHEAPRHRTLLAYLFRGVRGILQIEPPPPRRQAPAPRRDLLRNHRSATVAGCDCLAHARGKTEFVVEVTSLAKENHDQV